MAWWGEMREVQTSAHTRPHAPSHMHMFTFRQTLIHRHARVCTPKCSHTRAHNHMYMPTLPSTHIRAHSGKGVHTVTLRDIHANTNSPSQAQPRTPHADMPGALPKSLYQGRGSPSLWNPQATEEVTCGCPLSTTYRFIGQEIICSVPQPAGRPLSGRPGIPVVGEGDPN